MAPSTTDVPGATSYSGNRPRSGGTAVRFALVLALLGTVGYCGYQTWATVTANEAERKAAENNAAAATGLIDAVGKHLAPGFTDSAGTLLADPPKNPAELVDPQTIVLAHLQDDTDADSPAIDWKDFESHLSKAIGKPVTDLVYDSSPEQMAKFKTGAITLVALHPADAVFLVNNYGYHPMAVLGDDGKAAGNKLDLIVPASSPITKPADLKGRVLTCTVPSSITGYRAAVAVLARDVSLRPLADYQIVWSLKQKASITGIAEGKYEAAAVSDEKLLSMKAAGKIKPDSYKVIYQSDVVPRTTLGCFYNLKPGLAAKISQAVLAYDPPADADGDTGMKFVPTDYKRDFAFVRAIDDRFDPRLDSKIKKPAASATTQP
jgi:phosphonate transport system substrate-binding protein